MSRRDDGGPGAEGIFRLAPGFDATQLESSPEEAFLLSRLDGSTPWGLLVELSGFAPEWAEACLSRWVAAGAVELLAAPAADSCTDELELDAETRSRVTEFEARLGGTYHEILGVDAGADQRTIKKAYFQLSREFHPDRFFRAELGSWADRLSLIFKTILGAYEALSRRGSEASNRPAAQPESTKLMRPMDGRRS